ncbi:MAG: DEAD/DEAH box helicase [Planctomycetia bacterium]|nr:DEAD/DEAH box helicase [Planctomycetia bacterium]
MFNPKPEVLSIIPSFPRVEILTLGWNVALNRPPKIDVNQMDASFSPPVALTVRISPPHVRVQSYYFGNPDLLCQIKEKKKIKTDKNFNEENKVKINTQNNPPSPSEIPSSPPATVPCKCLPEFTEQPNSPPPLFGEENGSDSIISPTDNFLKTAKQILNMPAVPGQLFIVSETEKNHELFQDKNKISSADADISSFSSEELFPDGFSWEDDFLLDDKNEIPSERTDLQMNSEGEISFPQTSYSSPEKPVSTPERTEKNIPDMEIPSERIPFSENLFEEDRNLSKPTKDSSPESTPTDSPVRIQPPRDLIKLEDRLRYLLQPPLEQLYSDHNLHFPFEPFHYQWEGVSFLYSRSAAILADEMGLGKTMQSITTARLLLRNGDLRNILLICPKPLVNNWKREFEVWAPEIPVMIIEGDPTRRAWQWSLSDIPVKIANYELLNRDREFYAPNHGAPIHFDLVILDESQRIKNRSSATSIAARAISRNRNWALTGTPIENSSEDLIGIFEFLSPGYLHSHMKPGVMSRAINDYVLRRTKDLVLKDMPPRLYRDANLTLSPEQENTYKMAESQGTLRLSEMEDTVTIQHVFELVLRLKQICNFDPYTGESPKLQRLEADLEEVAASGRKAIIFSQWTETIFRLSKSLARFGPLEYHGKIPSSKRDAVIEQFRNSPDHHVLLMSYGAGSVGLNLQFCNYVFLFDRWWNPAVEDQAINRAHRIGVNGAVTITRFLMLGTIEERIDRVLQEKRELFEAIICGTSPSQKKLGLSQSEIFGLFNLKTPRGPIQIK